MGVRKQETIYRQNLKTIEEFKEAITETIDEVDDVSKLKSALHNALKRIKNCKSFCDTSFSAQ